MFRKLLPPLRRRRRIVLVASLPVVLAGAVLALTGGAGSGTAARGAHVGLVRAANTAAGGSAPRPLGTRASFGAHVIDGTLFCGNPPGKSPPRLPVGARPPHALSHPSAPP